MNVTVVAHEDTPPDELRSLRAWLGEEDELRGAVRLVESPPPPDKLGITADAVQIVAGSASTALAASVIAWIRTRTGRVRIVVKSKGKSVELDSATVRALDGEAVTKLATTLAEALKSETEQ